MDPRRHPLSIWQELAPYLALGWQLALSVLLFVAIGLMIDRWLDASPWGTLAGALLGMLAFCTQIFRLLAVANRKKPPDGATTPSEGSAAPFRRK